MSTLEGRGKMVATDSVAASERIEHHRIRHHNEGNTVYIAGPYTGSCSSVRLSGCGDFPVSSDWGRALLGIEAAFVSRGWYTAVPHRDISQWGAREMSAGQVAKECVEAVMECQLLVAYLGASYGTHVEVGVALARAIPIIAISTEESEGTFFGAGIMESSMVASVSVRRILDAPIEFEDNRSFARIISQAYSATNTYRAQNPQAL